MTITDEQRRESAYRIEVAATIRQQITVGVLMSLGAEGLRYLVDGDPGLTFRARILPSPTASARVMRVTVTLNAMDTYDIKVTYPKRGDRFTEVTHFEAEGVYNDALASTLLALDNVL